MAAGIAVIGLSANSPAQSLNAPVTWSRVSNRSGASLEAPTSILRRVKSDPNLVVLRDAAGKIHLALSTTLETRPGFPGFDPEGDMGLQRADCDVWPPEYRVVKDLMASYSCVLKGQVHYYLARYNGCNGVQLAVDYPVSLRAQWDQFVQRMVRTLKQSDAREIAPWASKNCLGKP